MTPLFSSLIFLIGTSHEDVAAIVTFARFVVSVSGVAYCNMKKVCQNSFFEEITPAAVICNRGEPFYLGIMTHPHFRFLLSFLHRVSSSDLLQIKFGPSLRVDIRLISLDRRKISTFLAGVIPGTFAVRL